MEWYQTNSSMWPAIISGGMLGLVTAIILLVVFFYLRGNGTI